MSWFLVKACPKCQADLASDDGDWLCLQCGTYYYPGLYRNSVHLPTALISPTDPLSGVKPQTNPALERILRYIRLD